MDNLELKAHDFKNGKKIREVKHLGNISKFEKEMEEDNFLTISGRVSKS